LAFAKFFAFGAWLRSDLSGVYFPFASFIFSVFNNAFCARAKRDILPLTEAI
jgi:hypothetical protein